VGEKRSGAGGRGTGLAFAAGLGRNTALPDSLNARAGSDAGHHCHGLRLEAELVLIKPVSFSQLRDFSLRMKAA